MERTKWTERRFSFDIPPGWLPNILERLEGTAPRLEALTRQLDEGKTGATKPGGWSIRQHIGHLSDLEELHEGRIDDFLTGLPTLRAADMSNLKTNEANHNGKDIPQLIREFSEKRGAFIRRLRGLDDATLQFRSLHPRLQMMMRPVDMAFFTAEHDDHHLASIRELINQPA